MEQELISTAEAAKVLGVSRVAVFQKIKSGQIKAKKIGRNFVIVKSDLFNLTNPKLTEAGKREIEQAVKKTVREYGETLRLLGKE